METSDPKNRYMWRKDWIDLVFLTEALKGVHAAYLVCHKAVHLFEYGHGRNFPNRLTARPMLYTPID